MLIYFPDLKYNASLPFYVAPLSQPVLPLRFETREQIQQYYDHVKCFVQLHHDGTKDGCRTLLKRFIHRDHTRLVKLVKKYFYVGVEGRKDERIRQFWERWGEIVKTLRGDEVEYAQETRCVKLIAHFARELDRFPKGSRPESWFQGRMTLLQKAFVQWPSHENLELLFSVLCSKTRIRKALNTDDELKGSFHVKFSLGDTTGEDVLIPGYTIDADVNVLDYLRKMTNILVESSLIMHEEWCTAEDYSTDRLFDRSILWFSEFSTSLAEFELAITNSGHKVTHPRIFSPYTQHFLKLELTRPKRPTRFTSQEQCQSYYDTVKQYVQLMHNGSVFGLRDLILHFIHHDQEHSLGVLVRGFGAGHLKECRGCFHCQLEQFWTQWEELVGEDSRVYISNGQLRRVIDATLEKFGEQLDALGNVGNVTKLLKDEMHAMQRALGMFPDLGLLERLVNVMCEKCPYIKDLIPVVSVTSKEGGIKLKKSTNVLMFMRELTQVVVEKATNIGFAKTVQSLKKDKEKRHVEEIEIKEVKMRKVTPNHE